MESERIMTEPFEDSRLDECGLLCRGCLISSGEMKNMIEWNLVEDFWKFTNIKIDNSDGLSSLLCSACEDKLMGCKRFQEQCCNSNLLLQNTMKKKNPDENTVTCVQYDKKIIIMITAPDMNAKIYLTCPFKCKDIFLKKSDLFYHLLKIHNVDKKIFIDLQYYCTFENCQYSKNSEKNKWFTNRKFLNQHYNKAHGNKIVCETCSLTFSTTGHYRRHLSTCNIEFSCPACDKQYKTHDILLVHLMRRHPDIHKEYKERRKSNKRTSVTELETKKARIDSEKFNDYICDSPKRSFATQTLKPEDNIKNDVALPSWGPKSDSYEAKTDEISTQTVFEDLLSLKSQTSEDDSILFPETVLLSDIQTQTFPIEFGLSRSNKETITSETQSPDLSIKETQTCYCLYDSPRSFRVFDSVLSSPNINFTSTETQTVVKSDVLLSFNSTETQTCFDDYLRKDSL